MQLALTCRERTWSLALDRAHGGQRHGGCTRAGRRCEGAWRRRIRTVPVSRECEHKSKGAPGVL